MTDRPILFSSAMIRALLAGTKTQTRRVLNPQPPADMGLIGLYAPALTAVFGYVTPDADHKVPLRYMPGDRLWVRETHYLTDDGDEEFAVYAADEEAVRDHHKTMERLAGQISEKVWRRHAKLRPSIHMPRWSSRLTLIVTGVKVERLQDISRGDAIAEGLIRIDAPTLAVKMGCDWGFVGDTRHGSPVSAYAALWRHINGPSSWDENPWVVALTFTVHKQNIDVLKEAA